MENWKTINNFENYEVSDLGRVRNKKTGKVLKPKISNSGYEYISLYKKGKETKKYIHRLMLENFKPCDNMNNLVVNHKDENKQNNIISNLEWLTQKENLNYGTHNERVGKTNSKIRCKIVIMINVKTNEIINTFNSAKETAKYLGLSDSTIGYRIKNKVIKDNIRLEYM